jgi:hypothetical protein
MKLVAVGCSGGGIVPAVAVGVCATGVTGASGITGAIAGTKAVIEGWDTGVCGVGYGGGS